MSSVLFLCLGLPLSPPPPPSATVVTCHSRRQQYSSGGHTPNNRPVWSPIKPFRIPAWVKNLLSHPNKHSAGDISQDFLPRSQARNFFGNTKESVTENGAGLGTRLQDFHSGFNPQAINNPMLGPEIYALTWLLVLRPLTVGRLLEVCTKLEAILGIRIRNIPRVIIFAYVGCYLCRLGNGELWCMLGDLRLCGGMSFAIVNMRLAPRGLGEGGL